MAPCSRCGTFLCGECTEVVDEEAWCADCVEWLRRNGPTSRSVKVAIGLSIAGIVSVPLCLFMAPVLNAVAAVAGLWLPTREIRRIRRGEGPLRGLRPAQVARVLAAVNLLLVVGWVRIVYFSR